MNNITPAQWIFLALAMACLCLDAYAIRKIFASPFYEPAQRWAQATIIVLVPVFGAYLTLYLARNDAPDWQAPPVDHVADLDPMCDDLDDRG